ncbi:hypothetical protein [Streptomyces regalis]|uniref:Uncharacterized protein n=1 Tax=Streptomyces regalis TaxID=68262 RepID=A0A0X3VP76_9ACTN|nr:hypothetical protein [Streptomyces regalis]KUL46187.1 hypothetical protein ADL12_02730 [Streptomyces regalis]
MSASENKVQQRPQVVAGVAGVSMRDLLAAGAAANVISTPPRAPEPEAPRPAADHGHREAA